MPNFFPQIPGTGRKPAMATPPLAVFWDSSVRHEAFVDEHNKSPQLAAVLPWDDATCDVRVVANACLEAALWAVAHPPPGRVAVVAGADADAFGGHAFVGDAIKRLVAAGYEGVAVVGEGPPGDASFVEWPALRSRVVSPEREAPAQPAALDDSLYVQGADALAIIAHLRRVDPRGDGVRESAPQGSRNAHASPRSGTPSRTTSSRPGSRAGPRCSCRRSTTTCGTSRAARASTSTGWNDRAPSSAAARRRSSGSWARPRPSRRPRPRRAARPPSRREASRTSRPARSGASRRTSGPGCCGGPGPTRPC